MFSVGQLGLLGVAFLLTVITMGYFLPKWGRAVGRTNFLLRTDENKPGRPKVPTLGGVAIVSCFVFSVVIVGFLARVLAIDSINAVLLNHALLTVALVALFGLVDDIVIIPRRFTKPILALLASLPMMGAAGLSTAVRLPFFGGVELGVLYLLLVPLFIIFSANAVNILSTYNGLETGLAIMVSLGLFAVAWINGSFTGVLFIVPFIAVLLLFFRQNKFPARIFLGNVGTLAVGAMLAVAALVAKAEFAFVIMMIPYFVHFLFYARNGFKWKPNMWGVPQQDGTLKCKYRKPFGLMHIILLKSKKATEQKVVLYLILLELLFVALAVALELFV